MNRNTFGKVHVDDEDDILKDAHDKWTQKNMPDLWDWIQRNK